MWVCMACYVLQPNLIEQGISYTRILIVVVLTVPMISKHNIVHTIRSNLKTFSVNIFKLSVNKSFAFFIVIYKTEKIRYSKISFNGHL